MRSFRSVVLALLVVMLALSVWGQTGTSAIRGTITDPQGRVVVGAAVKLINASTNTERTTKSTDTGAYAFDFIVPGTYRIEVGGAGFKTKAIGDVHAAVGKATETNVQLEIGATSEIVEVKSSEQAVLVNTQDASLGNVFVTQQIGQLPLEALNVVDLLSLQPGVTREGYVTGARADQSNVTLDGVDINNAQSANVDQTTGQVVGELSSSIIEGPVLRLNADAIDEFRVTTANANANQGRSSGSQVNLVTKSGTNKWHGSAFEFHRNTIFTANTWFNNHATDPDGNWTPVPRQALIRNTFGGSFGGPIVKNRVFFFYSYEGLRDAKSESVATLVPLGTLGAGQIKYEYCSTRNADSTCAAFTTNTLSASQVAQVYSTAGIDAAAVAVLGDAAAKYPANDTSVGDGLNTAGFRFNAPEPVKLNSHVAKLDFNLTKNQTAFLRANVIHDHQIKAQWLPDAPSPAIWSHPRGLAVAHTWTIGNNWVNNFRYGYTRQAFTDGGDSKENDIEFRFIFSPRAFSRDLSRTTPVHNFTDDVSWVRGNHSFQFGTNIRAINNSRVSYANAYDFAYTNPSFFLSGGVDISSLFQSYLDSNGLPGQSTTLPDGTVVPNMTSLDAVQAAGAALIGGLSEYTADFTFNKDGSLLPAGVPANRTFATQAYDFYVQDSWKASHSLTVTLGLRYSLERPVYETHGFEVQPTVPLGTYFQKRLAAAQNGQDFVDTIVIDRSGPANHRKPMYQWDKNNFQPRIALAWAPGNGKNVIRGGFAMTNDYYGQALAVDWDLNNTLGFTSNYTDPANTFSITGVRPLAPVFTAFGQDIRSLVPTNQLPSGLTFPTFALPIDIPNEIYGERIEQSVDSTLRAPKEYTWNLTFERQLPKDSVLSLSYIGRAGRGLLARRDIAAFNNLRDPQTGVDWYTAGTALEKVRQTGADISQIPALLPAKINQYFDNMFPAGLATVVNDFEGDIFDPTWTNAQAMYGFQYVGYFSGNDWTDTQAEIDLDLANDGYPLRFMQPQYGALSAWSSVGNSNYNALAVSMRTRLKSLLLDFNYTWSHSLDDASGLQVEGGYGNNQNNGAFIVNPIRQGDNYANSDFDVRHSINADAVWQLPFGKGRALLSNPHPALEAILGGWQLSSIFRWNTGLPTFSPFDNHRWATNWNVQANVTPTKHLSPCPSDPKVGPPKLFGACGDINAIYDSFRNTYPGETGPRNYLRLPGYIDVDLGLAKTWKMPYGEGHELQLRWDVFNVTNTQRFTAIDTSTRDGFGIGLDPALNHLVAPPQWSNFTAIQGNPRVMQVGLRYSF